jgi:hypothetical protein
MYLLDKKAEDLLSKIAFAQQKISEIKSPNTVLTSYIEPLQRWTDSLKNRVEQAKAEFNLFVQTSHFNQSESIQESHQRRLLAAILRDFEDIERRIRLGLDTFLPLIPIWNNQKNDKGTKQHHKLLMRFVSDMTELSHIDGQIMAIIGEGYACLPIEWEQRKHVIFGTYSEVTDLPKYVLLAHEIGHVFLHRNEYEISSNVIPQVLRKLSQNRPATINQNSFEQARYIWAQHWIPEFVSDCFAVKTLGPAFLRQFMLIALNSQPDLVEVSHPPSNLRMKFMVDILRSLNLSGFDINNYQNLWDSYALTVSTPNSLFIIDEEVVSTAFDCITATIIPTQIEDKWDEILKAKKSLEEGEVPNQDLISSISALAMEENGGDLMQINNEVLKRHSGNSDVS